MVKYYEVEGRLVKLTDDKVTSVFNCYVSIDRYNLIEEDGIFDGKEVHKGDVIVMLYDVNENKNRAYFILNSDSIISNKILRKKEDSLKRENEKEAPCNCECDCADPA